uniref:Galectin n=1 Tax=Moschus moschiferus TaxID=68415 RepID=A0A8C6FGF4_MOSMO
MAGSFNVPHKTSLPEGIRVGTVLRIRGLVPDKAGRFYVNLLCSEEPGSDAALHFNPRLDESTVVFNSLERGAWGAEERGSGIPFQRGQPFDVLLIATEEGFKLPPPPGGCRWLVRGGFPKQIGLRLFPRLLAVGSGQAPALCSLGQKRTEAPASPRRRQGTRRAGLPCRVGPHTSSSWVHLKAASAPQPGLTRDSTGKGEQVTCRRPVFPHCSHPATSRLGLSGFRGSLGRH